MKDREIQQLKYELQVKQNTLTSDHRGSTASSDSALTTLSNIGPLDYVADGGNARQPRNRWNEEVYFKI